MFKIPETVAFLSDCLYVCLYYVMMNHQYFNSLSLSLSLSLSSHTHTQSPKLEKSLLRPQRKGEEQKKCVVIDLDETLVHSSFKVSNCQTVDYVAIHITLYVCYLSISS